MEGPDRPPHEVISPIGVALALVRNRSSGIVPGATQEQILASGPSGAGRSSPGRRRRRRRGRVTVDPQTKHRAAVATGATELRTQDRSTARRHPNDSVQRRPVSSRPRGGPRPRGHASHTVYGTETHRRLRPTVAPSGSSTWTASYVTTPPTPAWRHHVAGAPEVLARWGRVHLVRPTAGYALPLCAGCSAPASPTCPHPRRPQPLLALARSECGPCGRRAGGPRSWRCGHGGTELTLQERALTDPTSVDDIEWEYAAGAHATHEGPTASCCANGPAEPTSSIPARPRSVHARVVERDGGLELMLLARYNVTAPDGRALHRHPHARRGVGRRPWLACLYPPGSGACGRLAHAAVHAAPPPRPAKGRAQAARSTTRAAPRTPPRGGPCRRCGGGRAHAYARTVCGLGRSPLLLTAALRAGLTRPEERSDSGCRHPFCHGGRRRLMLTEDCPRLALVLLAVVIAFVAGAPLTGQNSVPGTVLQRAPGPGRHHDRIILGSWLGKLLDETASRAPSFARSSSSAVTADRGGPRVLTVSALVGTVTARRAAARRIIASPP